MSRQFGPATQNGIVVADLDDALEHWTRGLGVGPFFRIDNLQNEAFAQRGVAWPAPKMSVALGNWGDLQIELICPHGEGESTWHQFLKRTGGGLHHISVWSTSYDSHIRLAQDTGLEVECEGKILGGPRYCYFGSETSAQPFLEISEYTPQSATLFARIRDAARSWDGEDPVRGLP